MSNVTLQDVQRGFEAWAAKPHNAKWVRRLDGTPIANDVVVNIFEAMKGRLSSSPAASDVLAERQRQIEVEGWTAEFDDGYRDNELARAAACYAVGVTAYWPWDLDWWKPSERRRDLVKAAALLIAEIERLDRAAAGASWEGPADV